MFLEWKQQKNWYYRPLKNFSAFYSLETCYSFLMHADLLSRIVFPTDFLLLFHFVEERGRTFREPTGFHIAFWSSEDQTKSSHLVQIGHSSNRGIYNVIFWGSDAHQASIQEILKHVFISHFPISQKNFLILLAKHCLKLRFLFNISFTWAVQWWFLLLGLARKTFRFIHIAFFKHLFWGTILKWQNNDRLKNSHYPI